MTQVIEDILRKFDCRIRMTVEESDVHQTATKFDDGAIAERTALLA